MSKKKKFLRFFLPCVPFVYAMVVFGCICAFNPDVAEAARNLPYMVALCLAMFGFALGTFADIFAEYVSLFFDHKEKKVSLTVRIEESSYSELQELADRTGAKSVSEVIPGVLAYVLNGIRDQEVTGND